VGRKIVYGIVCGLVTVGFVVVEWGEGQGVVLFVNWKLLAVWW
jgi:hypothetical protein